MPGTLLIDSIVRQTTVLIATLATAAGSRPSLAHVANQVLLNLADELKARGIGNKVVADMFGMALRTYHDRVARLAESKSESGRSLWDAVLAYLEQNGTHQHGPIARDAIRRLVPLADDALDAALAQLLADGRLRADTSGAETQYRAERVFISYGDPATGRRARAARARVRGADRDCERRRGRRTTRGMLGILVRAALVLVLLPALAACSKSRSPSVGGETNWLLRCSEDKPCELGSCRCGVCTQACDDDESCDRDFEGTCTDTDDGAGALLCQSSARPPAAAVCLPRCSSDDACGRGYQCEQAVCVPAVRASGGPPGVGGRDGSVAIIDTPLPDDGGPSENGGSGAGGLGGAAGLSGTGSTDPEPRLYALAQSRATWTALVAENANTYWYTEENCGPNGSREPRFKSSTAKPASSPTSQSTSVSAR
ncbi:MAG TPA: hypothetical protein VK509_22210 [Polyangiales bacterium]|nr:hypothetical protein [Polyangiales bacterium]